MEQEIKKAILEALNKFAEFSLSQELMDSGNYLLVYLGPSDIHLWLHEKINLGVIHDCYLIHPNEAEDYELKTDELIDKIKSKFEDPAEVLSTLNTGVNE